MSKVGLVTGANSGLGFEAVKQLAERSDFGKVILAVRSKAKGNEAVLKLEDLGVRKSKLTVLVVDVSSVHSTNKAVDKLIQSKERIDFLLLNAGRIGGSSLERVEDSGMEVSYAASLAGHSVLAIRLSRNGNMNEGSTIVFAGSEAATGQVPGMKLQDIGKFSRKHFGGQVSKAVVCLAKSEKPASYSAFESYATLKAVLVWFVEALAIRFKENKIKIKVFAISPGATPGTNASSNMPGVKRFLFEYIGKPVMRLSGKGHSVDTAVKRYLSGMDLGEDVSGHFFASPKGKTTGKLTDNSLLFDHFLKDSYREGSYTAITSLVGLTL